ncbi:MAG: hypothetical protein AB9834_13715 [Lentimicrobium sp.]
MIRQVFTENFDKENPAKPRVAAKVWPGEEARRQGRGKRGCRDPGKFARRAAASSIPVLPFGISSSATLPLALYSLLIAIRITFSPEGESETQSLRLHKPIPFV